MGSRERPGLDWLFYFTDASKRLNAEAYPGRFL